MPTLALKDNQKSRVMGRSNGGIIRSACRAKLPESVNQTPENITRAIAWLGSVFPKRIKLEERSGITYVSLVNPRRGECDKFEDCLKQIVEAIAEGREPTFLSPSIVGTGILQGTVGTKGPNASPKSSELPTRRYERAWRRIAAS